MGQKGKKVKEALMMSKEDMRDNVIHYDDEGGGEEDTKAFDICTLRNSRSKHNGILSSNSRKEKNGYGEGVLMHLCSRGGEVKSPEIHCQPASVISTISNKAPLSSRDFQVTEGDTEFIKEIIEQQLEESQQGYLAPPYDSLVTYAYEGDGSVASSFCSNEESWIIADSGDFSSLVSEDLTTAIPNTC